MNFQNYVLFFTVVASFGILYNKWELKYLEKEQINYNANIKNFLLNRKTISDYDLFSKPFIWIHVDNELNTRLNSRYFPSQELQPNFDL